MPFDAESKDDLAKLDASITYSDQRKRVRAQQLVDHVKQLVGKHYGDNGSDTPVPINMIELAVNIYQRAICSHTPQALVESDYPQLQPAAADMELALNQEVKRVHLQDTLNAASVDSLFCLGMVEVGITTSGDSIGGEGYLSDPGHLFCESISFADAILDMMATSLEDMDYVGHRFWVPREWVRNNQDYDEEVRNRVAEAGEREFGGKDNSIHPESIQRGEGPVNTEYRDKICLQQVFMKDENLVMIRVDGAGWPPLKKWNWEGPTCGMYHFLGHGKAPGNLIPTAPVPYWVDLHDVINRSFNLAREQAEDSKKILGVPRNALDDGNAIINAPNGMAVPMTEPGACKEFSFGGADQTVLGMVMYSRQMLDYLAGNLSAMGGLAAQSKTVGQDELLQSQSSSRLKDMQQTMTEFVAGIFQSMAFWLWHDPISEYHLIKPIPGAPAGMPGIPVQFGPDQKMGRFFDYNFSVSPFAKSTRSPTEQAQALMGAVQNIIIPMMPMIQPQGININFEYLFETMSKYMDIPELDKLLVYQNGQQNPPGQPIMPQENGQGQGPSGDPPPMPQNTNRTYTRVSQSGSTLQGSEAGLLKSLLAGSSENEMGSLASTGQ